MTANSFFVYRHIRLDTNQPFYIGIGKKPKKFNTHRREYKRAYDKYHRSDFWKNIVEKAGYKVEIVFEADTVKDILEKEVEFISLYKRYSDGGTLCNITSGGEFTYEQMLLTRSNGAKHTEATKKKISKAHRGKEVSDVTRKLLSKANKNRKSYLSINTKEAREKSINTRKKRASKVIDLETGNIYESLSDACSELGLNLKKEHQRITKKSSTQRLDYLEPNKSRSKKIKP